MRGGYSSSALSCSQNFSEHLLLKMAYKTPLAMTPLVQEHICKRGASSPTNQNLGRKYRWIRLPALRDAKAELYNAFLGVRNTEN
jgi:hypothetical protein